MSIIIINNLTLSYGERILFNEISAHIDSHQKIGIVGNNGSGKSTLFKVICGLIQQDSGEIILNKHKKIAYLPQEVILESQLFIFDEVFSVFDEVIVLKKKYTALEILLNSGNATMEEIEEFQAISEKLLKYDENKLKQKTYDIVLGLGFREDEIHQKKVSQLSVGWKMRVVLAKLLLEEADFYLFDEPTNHLDIVTQQWFLQFLKNSSFGYMLITHDRHFLDNCCKSIINLCRGKLTQYNGNYSKFLDYYKEQQEKLKMAHFQQQKEIEHTKELINKFRASASKASFAQSLIKKLDKMELVEIDPPEPSISVSFSHINQPGSVVLELNNISFSYPNKHLFSNVSCCVKRGEKVALVAANGVGKSTLFDIIIGKLQPKTGTVSFGHNVTHAFFEQDQNKALNQYKSILEEILYSCKGSEQSIRSMLGSFLFKNDDINKKIEMLSGGEKNRVAMVKVLLKNGNFLLLDEPTNHLDLQSKSVLLQALKQYPGTLLFVSHDYQFIQSLATSIMELTPTGINYIKGSYEDFLFYKQHNNNNFNETNSDIEQHKKQKKIDIKQNNTSDSNNDEKKLAKQIERLEFLISDLEHKKEKISLIFSTISYGSQQYHQETKKINQLEEEIKNLKKQLD